MVINIPTNSEVATAENCQKYGNIPAVSPDRALAGFPQPL